MAVTQLYKESQKEKAKSFQLGYSQCFDDLMHFIGLVPSTSSNYNNTDNNSNSDIDTKKTIPPQVTHNPIYPNKMSASSIIEFCKLKQDLLSSATTPSLLASFPFREFDLDISKSHHPNLNSPHNSEQQQQHNSFVNPPIFTFTASSNADNPLLHRSNKSQPNYLGHHLNTSSTSYPMNNSNPRNNLRLFASTSSSSWNASHTPSQFDSVERVGLENAGMLGNNIHHVATSSHPLNQSNINNIQISNFSSNLSHSGLPLENSRTDNNKQNLNPFDFAFNGLNSSSSSSLAVDSGVSLKRRWDDHSNTSSEDFIPFLTAAESEHHQTTTPNMQHITHNVTLDNVHSTDTELNMGFDYNRRMASDGRDGNFNIMHFRDQQPPAYKKSRWQKDERMSD